MQIDRILSLPDVKFEIERKIGRISFHETLHGGSDRHFERVIGSRNRSILILIDPNSHRRERYITNARYMDENGIAVPKVWRNMWEHGVLIIEDLGDIHLTQYINNYTEPKLIYDKIIDTLILMQSQTYRCEPPVMLQKNFFNRERLLGESSQFINHLIREFLEYDIRYNERLNAEFLHLAESIDAQPKLFMHRDFQSQNIMISDGVIHVIDFQDAAIGPYSYDLASLLEDPYVDLDHDLREYLKSQYIERMLDLQFAQINFINFVIDYRNSAISRLLQASGAFARLTIAGKSQFQEFIEPALRRLIELTKDSGFDQISELVGEVLCVECGEEI
jgi:aminoglycoside/choline kinase family phosphotransferase